MRGGLGRSVRDSAAMTEETRRIHAAVRPILAKPHPRLPPPPEDAVAETVAYLESPAARESLARDCYWPKWDTPWWRIVLLEELGLAHRVPAAAVRALADRARAQYLDHFPLKVEDVPAGVDPVMGIMCHCGLGTLDRVLAATGLDPDVELPYARGWYVRYAMSDGGWNCDEAAYLKESPKASVVSTLPVAEALLRRAELTGDERRALDAAGRYLLQRQLFRSVSKHGAIMDPAWLEPTFPRFYEYDVLRGLTFVVRWMKGTRSHVGAPLVEAVEELARRTAPDGTLAVHRRAWDGAKTMREVDGVWTRGQKEASFPLLDAVSQVGMPSAALTREWRQTAHDLLGVLQG